MRTETCIYLATCIISAFMFGSLFWHALSAYGMHQQMPGWVTAGLLISGISGYVFGMLATSGDGD